MFGIRVLITRYVSDDQPGVVECRLVDAQGRLWIFVEKTAIVSAKHLYADTVYPQPGVIAGEIVNRVKDASGQEIVTVDTTRPWYIESVQGATRFEVLPESIVEWEQ